MLAPGLEQVAGGCQAWVQPDGGWGLSNAGLVVGEGESLLVDTLFDLPRTRAMLDALAVVTDDSPIRTVVNTHGNGDHWFGNELVADASIISAEATLADMREVGPDLLVSLLGMPGEAGDYVRQIFGGYHFEGISPTYPDRTFTDDLELSVGGVDVLLLDVGPAHTAGDTIVYVERDGVVFTGDIVFAGGTPVVWDGPFGNWLAACRRILDLGATLMVPGHGPVSPVARVQDMADYLDFVHAEASARHSRGMPAQAAALDIDLGRFAAWPESERLAVNVATVYRELEPDPAAAAAGPELFGCMAELFRHRLRPAAEPGGSIGA